jgi:membrane protease YdiL (CAAX protease family)
VSGVGVEAPRETGSEAGHELSPWDWTDVLLSVPLTVVLGTALGFGLVAIVVPFLPAHDHELRNAVAKFLVQFSLYAGVVGAVVGLVVLRRHASLRTLGWRPVSTRWLVGAVPLALAAYVLVVFAGVVGNGLFPQAHNGQPKAVRDAFGHYQLLAVVAVSLIAPFAEETLFRGFLYGWLRGRVPLWAAVALSALVFALGSLLPGMIIHAVFNLIGVTLIFSSGR